MNLDRISNRPKRKNVFVPGTALALLLVAAAGHAATLDSKTFSGLNCVQLMTNTPSLLYVLGGISYNSSGANSINVMCPVVRDDPASTMDITDWDITVNRNGSNLAWDIKLWSENKEGSAGSVNTISVPADAGTQTLDGGEINNSFTNGQLYITTTLPPGAQLHSYFIEEETN